MEQYTGPIALSTRSRHGLRSWCSPLARGDPRRRNRAPAAAIRASARVTAASADATRLQSQLLALADTALGARHGSDRARHPGQGSGGAAVQPQQPTGARYRAGRDRDGPDPVDALLDMVTHTTLVADGMRNEAKGKPSDSPQANLLKALELNEADAWKLAERWADAPTRCRAARAHSQLAGRAKDRDRGCLCPAFRFAPRRLDLRRRR